MEVYLYRCENCSSAKFFNEDHGRTFYVNQCNGCQGWSYYEKVVLSNDFAYSLFGVFQGHRFVLEEKKNDRQEKE